MTETIFMNVSVWPMSCLKSLVGTSIGGLCNQIPRWYLTEESYKHNITNKTKTLRPLESSMINYPCVVLLWTDPPAVAAGPDFGWHRLLKKGKAWSRSEMITRGRQGTGHADIIPRNPALWIWRIQFHLSPHAWLPICKNMNINFSWQRAKIGGYQDPWSAVSIFKSESPGFKHFRVRRVCAPLTCRLGNGDGINTA